MLLQQDTYHINTQTHIYIFTASCCSETHTYIPLHIYILTSRCCSNTYTLANTYTFSQHTYKHISLLTSQTHTQIHLITSYILSDTHILSSRRCIKTHTYIHPHTHTHTQTTLLQWGTQTHSLTHINTRSLIHTPSHHVTAARHTHKHTLTHIHILTSRCCSKMPWPDAMQRATQQWLWSADSRSANSVESLIAHSCYIHTYIYINRYSDIYLYTFIKQIYTYSRISQRSLCRVVDCPFLAYMYIYIYINLCTQYIYINMYHSRGANSMESLVAHS